MVNGCPECLKKQREIDRLHEEILSLKDKLRYQERKAKEGYFGSSTPSSKVPAKENTVDGKERKPRGAKAGHRGAGRKVIDAGNADKVQDIGPEAGEVCPDCGCPLESHGVKYRSVIESRPVKAERIQMRLHQRRCTGCKKVFTPRVPGVLPHSLYGNQLVVNAAVMHYLHGIPMGRVCEQLGVLPGSLVDIFHRLAGLFDRIPERLIEEYRASPVKHADETGWRTDGKNGYAWLFATERLSIFQFKRTRSGEVARAVFGKDALPGTLVIDRYAGYNKVPCTIQYCYAHLIRDIEDLEKEFPDVPEIIAFVDTMVSLLTLAIRLRNQAMSDAQFLKRAAEVKQLIVTAVEGPAEHPGIRDIQNIFRKNAGRMYAWATDRRVPADNNLAERDLRPTVIARKVSFGSQSDAGARTRGVLMSVLTTLKKRGVDVAAYLKEALDGLAMDTHADPYPLLFRSAGPPSPSPAPTHH
jgi:transposase